MLWTVKKAAYMLQIEPHQVYYLLVMGYIEAAKIGRVWRVVPESVEEYDKRYPERKNRKPSGNFIYPGSGGFLFCTPPDYFPPDPHRKTSGVGGRRRELVHRPNRSKALLDKELQSIIQQELFTA